MKFPSTALLVSVLAAMMAPSAVLAQLPTPADQPAPEQVRRPYRGLFGAPADPAKSRQSLDLTASASGAYDDDMFGSETDPSPLAHRYVQRGWYTSATAGLVYNRPGERIAFQVEGDAAANRYLQRHETATMLRGGGSVSARLASATRATVGGDFVYAPQYRLGLFFSPTTPTGGADPFGTVAPDLDLFLMKAYRTSVQASLTQSLGRRASLDGYYSLNSVNYTDSDFDYRSDTAGIRFIDRLTRHLAARIGYAYGTADYARIRARKARRIHNIDAGVDYGRALSFSRRTTFSFSTGSAIVSGADRVIASGGNALSYRFTGTATLRHEVGRTWTAALGYRRGVDWQEGFDEPFLSDGVTASFGGFISRRLRFSSSADYMFGSVGFGGANNGYDSASAQAGLEYALSRTLAVFGRYVYYRYQFGSGVVLDPRFAPELNRQGVRFGITASVPLVR